MRNLFVSLLIALGILGMNSCSKKNVEDAPATNAQTTTSESTQTQAIDTDPTGTYECKRGPQSCELTISGSTWSAKTMMASGFGAEYDESNATYERGIIDGNALKDETGYVTIGSVSQSKNGEWDISLNNMSFDKVR